MCLYGRRGKLEHVTTRGVDRRRVWLLAWKLRRRDVEFRSLETPFAEASRGHCGAIGQIKLTR